MSRHPLRSLARRGLALVCVTGAVGVAHAASLGGISEGTLDAWSYPAEIVVEDTTPPTITASISPAANLFGWHNSAATVTFACDDDSSGIASCTGPVTLGTEGSGQVVIGDAVDNAGNTASTSVTLDVDLTGPAVEIVGVTDGDVVAVGPAVSCDASDALSGLAGPCVVTVAPGSGGSVVVTATATDRADNVTIETAEYRVLTICGVGPPNVPCVVPYGTVFDGDLDWNADVLVLGEVTKKIDVVDGSVTVGATGIVGKDIEQTGAGGVTVVAGGFVDGKIEESGAGSILVDGVVTKDVEEEDDGDVVVGPTAHIDGKVKEAGPGSVSVHGQVDDDVDEDDDGDVIVGPTAHIDGKVKEAGPGSVSVHGQVDDDVEEKDDGDLVVGPTAHIDGTVKESGPGSVTIGGSVTKDVTEDDDGDLTIASTATVTAKAKESGPGSVVVGGTVTETVEEKGPGNLDVLAGSSIGDDAVEADAGNLTAFGPSSIGDELEESGGGDMTINAFVVAARADSTGGGSCTISPAATVPMRSGACS